MTIPCIYEPDGNLFIPTKLAFSPWERNKQNGVALAGLLTHLLEQIPNEIPFTVTRLSIDILAAAPAKPTSGRSRIIRPGKRIQLAEAELLVDEIPVARATALSVRVAESPICDGINPYPSPETVEGIKFEGAPHFGYSIEARAVHGAMRTPGPATAWVRFAHQHVAGVPLTPLVRTATLADFCSGFGSDLPPDGWSFPNVDITIHFTRAPVGEWLLIDTEFRSAGNGTAIASGILADRQGPFARAYQSLFVSHRL